MTERDPASEPEGRGPTWTEERQRSDEGRQDLKAPRRRASQKTPRASRKHWRAGFFALALVGITGVVAWALLGSKLLVVRSVAVTGTHLVPAGTVLAVAGVPAGTPMVRVNTGQIAARVAGIRDVRSVQVTKSWPDRIVIAVTERTSVVAVAAPGGGYDLVDAAGVVVRWVSSRPARFPLYQSAVPAAQLTGSPSVALAAAVLTELPDGLRPGVRSVQVSDDQVSATLATGVTVVWGGADRPAAKAQVLTILMRTHAKYYDVSAPGVAMTEG